MTTPLSPLRRELVNHLGRIIELEAEHDRLKKGRADLAGRIAHAEAAAAKLDQAKTAGADNILSAIRRGASFSFESALNLGNRLTSARIDASAVDLDIARRALTKLDAEIAETESELTAMIEQRDAAASRAVREFAVGTVAAEYTRAIDAARAAMVRLAALSPQSEFKGRIAGQVPGFGLVTGQMQNVDVPVVATPANIAAARAIWDKLRAAWLEDPFIDPAAIAQFPAVSNAPDTATAFHALSPAEQRLVDLKFAR